MKKPWLFNFALVFVYALFTQDSFAQEYTRWGLPEGFLARLGKGSIGSGDRAVAYSPDGSRLAVASSIGIWLYDAHTGAEVAMFTGHTDGVTSVSFSPDGTRLASGSADGTVRLWDMASGELIATLKGHTDGVTSVSFSPDGTRLASGSRDGRVRLWDGPSGEPIATLEGNSGPVYSVSFSPDGTRLAFGSSDGTTLVWDMAELTNPGTAVTEHTSISLPDELQLHQNAPNPFNSHTVISYFLPESSPVRLELFSVTGQRVGKLHQGPKKAGVHRVHWDGRDEQDRPLASGVYLYRLTTYERIQTRKLTLLR